MLPYIDCFDIAIYTFPIILTIGFLLCVVFFIARKSYDKTFYKTYVKMIFWILPSSLLGGKIISVLSLVFQNKGCLLECIIQSGTVYYGCLFGGAISLFILAKFYHMYWLDIFDICASLLPLGQAIGRIGCFLNGCCYGCQYYGFASVLYPINGEIVSVFPTWFCESIFCFILFILLQIILIRTNSGIITTVYLICYSSFRFIIEFLRGDSIRGTFSGVSTSQILSVAVFIFAIFLYYISKQRNVKNNLLLEEKS